MICRQPADFKPPQPPIQTSGFKLRYLFQTAANLHRAPAPPLGEALPLLPSVAALCHRRSSSAANFKQPERPPLLP
ncbi:hypothetical protein MUK42_23664 [Musa troglodytarum]|uniref:Uncharacterized protein n=1 Tax=Musa troglodytarum TaxID=320322 RepID=A0A9E7IC88_9LILI|nr:hypothetical protein MUK42_23664 [Musa troglodytarum]